MTFVFFFFEKTVIHIRTHEHKSSIWSFLNKQEDFILVFHFPKALYTHTLFSAFLFYGMFNV